jgi:hypothetical protein
LGRVSVTAAKAIRWGTEDAPTHEGSMPLDEGLTISDVDRDSLHILPLTMLPLKTAGLKRARMIKNARLESVVELFIDRKAGSGQIPVNDVGREFSWPADKPNADLFLLRRLAPLPSYDVYSLRIQFRDLSVPLDDVSALKISEKKRKELTSYMTAFTRPLIAHVYGDDDVSIKDIDDVIRLFKDPDVKKAQEKLKVMAEKLEIDAHDIPEFLEDYGDIFLSLSYYKQCLDVISPILEDFFQALDSIRRNRQLQHNSSLIQTCDSLHQTLTGLVAQISARFVNFDQASRLLWDNITAERFRKMERLVQSHHVTVGGMLCALTVKMSAWRKPFPTRESGGLLQRAEFIMSELHEGIDKMQELIRDALKPKKVHHRL